MVFIIADRAYPNLSMGHFCLSDWLQFRVKKVIFFQPMTGDIARAISYNKELLTLKQAGSAPNYLLK